MIATLGSLLLIAYVFWAYGLKEGEAPVWTFNLAVFVAALVAVMTLLGLWQLWQQYRQGYLFPLRNATLLLTILSLAAMPLLLIWEIIVPNSVQTSTLLLLPVFLFMISRSLFRIKIDQVALEAKLGFGQPTYIPLYNIASVTEDDNSITISRNDGGDIRLLRVFFFPATWERLRERFKQLTVS